MKYSHLRYAAALLLGLLSPAAGAAERFDGTIFGIQQQDNWQTGQDTGYWNWHGEGVLHAKGPFGAEPIDCRGAGYWEGDAIWGEGICLIGAGEHVASLFWRRSREQAQRGDWEIRGGTGRYSGLAAKGSWTDHELANDRWIAELAGEITPAN